MAAFDKSAELSHPVDYQLVVNGFVSMFWAQHVLDTTLQWLSARDYQLVTLQAGEWRQTKDLHQAFAEALDFPNYYGKNLDALNDCLRDVALGEYVWTKALLVSFWCFADLTCLQQLNPVSPRQYWTYLPIAPGTRRFSGNG